MSVVTSAEYISIGCSTSRIATVTSTARSPNGLYHTNHRASRLYVSECRFGVPVPVRCRFGAGSECCDKFLYGFKGTPSARQADQPWPCSRRIRATCTEKRERAEGARSVSDRGSGASRRRWRAAWPAASSAGAHRRGPLPATPLPRTSPQATPRRYAPLVTRAARAGRAVALRQNVPIAERRGHSRRGRNAAHCPGRPSARKGTRRSFLTAPQKPLRRKHLRDPPLRAEPLPTLRA